MDADTHTLTPRVKGHIQRLFPDEQQEDVLRRLNDECGAHTLYRKMDWSELSERVQCAILKVSNGQIDKFEKALDLYRDNWNNLLVEAGFGNDPEAHLKWTEE